MPQVATTSILCLNVNHCQQQLCMLDRSARGGKEREGKKTTECNCSSLFLLLRPLGAGKEKQEEKEKKVLFRFPRTHILLLPSSLSPREGKLKEGGKKGGRGKREGRRSTVYPTNTQRTRVGHVPDRRTGHVPDHSTSTWPAYNIKYVTHVPYYAHASFYALCAGRAAEKRDSFFPLPSFYTHTHTHTSIGFPYYSLDHVEKCGGSPELRTPEKEGGGKRNLGVWLFCRKSSRRHLFSHTRKSLKKKRDCVHVFKREKKGKLLKCFFFFSPPILFLLLPCLPLSLSLKRSINPSAQRKGGRRRKKKF